jgi:hypothetical protein
MQLDVAYDSIYSTKAKINYMCHMQLKITCIQWLQNTFFINDFLRVIAFMFTNTIKPSINNLGHTLVIIVNKPKNNNNKWFNLTFNDKGASIQR